VAITLGVLFLLVIASFYLVRRALQPLNQVEQTAGRIAEGQLDRRVPDWSPTTEVGRLSVALNRMLEQIQGAFIKVNQSEQQAREAEQQARSAESSMRRFIGDASHELRTPLTSVRGYADLYKSGATEDADMVIDRISSEAGRMSLLVEDLLTLVRMDEGRPMRSDLVDLLELCIAAVDNARAGFPGRSISVQNETGSIPLTVGDQNRLHPGRRQPADQRAAPRWGGRLGRPAPHPAGRRPCRHRDRRRRGGHRRRGPAPPVRAVLPGGCLPVAGLGRVRAGTVDRQEPRRVPRWHDHRGEHTGGGDDLPDHPAGRRHRRRGRGGGRCRGGRRGHRRRTG
jgi:HAMP domain-containing protein